MKKAKSLILWIFSPDAFQIVFLFMSLLGVCPVVAPTIEPYLKLLHVYALGVLVIDFVSERRIFRNKGRAILVIFVLSYLITMLTNRNLFGFSYLSNFCYYVECLSLVYSFGRRSDDRNTIVERLIAVVISCANLINIWMFFAKFHIYIPERGYLGMFPDENRLAGLFGNPNVLGMVCLGGIVLSLICAANEKKQSWRIFYLVLCFVNYITLLLANSRTQIYSVAIMGFVIVFALLLKNERNVKQICLAVFSGLMCMVVVISGGRLLQLGMSALDVNYEYYVLNISNQKDIFQNEQEVLIADSEEFNSNQEVEQKSEITVEPGEEDVQKSDSNSNVETIERSESSGFNGRIDLWKIGWQLFLARPIFGTGMDNHDNALRDLGMEVLPVRGNFHNVYLEVLVDFGIVGFACLVIYLLTMLLDVVRLFQFGDGDNWTLNAVLLGAVVAFLVDGLADSTLVSSLYPTAIFFWMTASRYAYFLEQENTRTGHFKPGILCRLTDSLTAKIHQKG